MVRFQCERCGRHYAVSEALRGRSFRLKCRACGETVVVHPETVPGENPFVAHPVTASTASLAAARAALEGAEPAGTARSEGPDGAHPAPEPPGPASPPAGSAPAGSSSTVAAPGGSRPPGAIPVLQRAGGQAGEAPSRADGPPDLAPDIGGGRTSSGSRGRRQSPAVEELRRALAEALDEGPAIPGGGDGGRADPIDLLSDVPAAGAPAAEGAAAGGALPVAEAGGPGQDGSAGGGAEGPGEAEWSEVGRTEAGRSEAGWSEEGWSEEGRSGAGWSEEGRRGAGQTEAERGEAGSSGAGGDEELREGAFAGPVPTGDEPGQVPAPAPARPLFQDAGRPARGPLVAIAVAAFAVAAIVAGVLAVRREGPTVRATGAPTSAAAPEPSVGAVPPPLARAEPDPGPPGAVAATPAGAPASPALPASAPPAPASPPGSPRSAAVATSPDAKPGAAPPPTGASAPPRATLRPGATLPPAATLPPRSAESTPPRRRTPPTADEVSRAAAAVREAFDACFAAAPAVPPGARPPRLLATVQPSGEVAFPTLDDLESARTPFGDCVKEAARKMTFPPFDGKPARIELPLPPPPR